MKLKLFTTEREATLEETRRFWNEGVGKEADDWRLELGKNSQEIEVWHANAETGEEEVVEYLQAPIGEPIDEYGLVDVDGDGDLDLMFGNWRGHAVAFNQEAQIAKLKHHIEEDPKGTTPTGFWAGQFLGALEREEEKIDPDIKKQMQLLSQFSKNIFPSHLDLYITVISRPVESPEDVSSLSLALNSLKIYDLSDQKPLLEILVALYEGTIGYFTRPENKQDWEKTRLTIKALLQTQNPDWWGPKLLDPIVDGIEELGNWLEIFKKVDFAKYPESYLKIVNNTVNGRYHLRSYPQQFQFFSEHPADRVPQAQKVLAKVLMESEADGHKVEDTLEIIASGKPDRWKNSEELFEAIDHALDIAVVNGFTFPLQPAHFGAVTIDTAIAILLKMNQRLPDYLIERLGGLFEELHSTPFPILVGSLLDLLSRQNLEPDNETRKIVEAFLKKFPDMAQYFYGTEKKSEDKDRHSLLRTVEAFCKGDVVVKREATEEIFGLSVEIFFEMSDTVNPVIYERRANDPKLCTEELPKVFEEIFLKQ